jgi:hypothetical protein
MQGGTHAIGSRVSGYASRLFRIIKLIVLNCCTSFLFAIRQFVGFYYDYLNFRANFEVTTPLATTGCGGIRASVGITGNMLTG